MLKTSDKRHHYHHHHGCSERNIRVADAHSPNYFRVLQKAPAIKTLLLHDDIDGIKHYLRSTYYDYASNDCYLLERKSKYGQRFAEKHYGSKCRPNMHGAWLGHQLSEAALSVGIPDRLTSRVGANSRLLTFIHIIPDAISFQNGDVFHDDIKIVPQRCSRNLKKQCPPDIEHITSYREVFTISQSWGSGFYHGTLEDLPRIAPYLSFLKAHPDIKIHTPAGRIKYLALLGIQPSRLVQTKALHADILYMPAGGTCGRSSLFTTQVLAGLLDKDRPPPAYDTIVLIKRKSRGRRFDNHHSILSMLEKHAVRVNLTVKVFDDNPLPGLQQTVDMFRTARIVVAPHGAGESNLIFSQAGTLLIEGLCFDSDKMANLCYRNMAQALGLRYYGLIYKYQCMKITAKQIEVPLLEYLRLELHYDGTNHTNVILS